MSVIYIVLPIALLLAVLGLAAFIWAVRKGQFDDLDSPSMRMLFDDEEGDEGGNHNDAKSTKEDSLTATKRLENHTEEQQ